MAKAAFDDDNEDKPLDPGVDRVRRRLIRFMIVNFVLLFVALMAVVAAIVYKTRTVTPNAGAARSGEIPAPNKEGLSGDIMLPAGATINSHMLSGDRISIDATLSDGTRAIFVYDMTKRRMAGRFDIRSNE